MRSSSFARVVIAGLGIAVVSTLGCDKSPGGPSSPTVTVVFSGRVVNADVGGPVANVQVSLQSSSIFTKSGDFPSSAGGWFSKTTATSGGDGTFSLRLNLPIGWEGLALNLTGPAGYDHRNWHIWPAIAANRPEISMYPTLAIRPGESIEVRVDGGIQGCGLMWDAISCRRVVVAASPGDPVELEIVPHDSSKPMALGSMSSQLGRPLILKVPPGEAWVISDFSTGTATLTARR